MTDFDKWSPQDCSGFRGGIYDDPLIRKIIADADLTMTCRTWLSGDDTPTSAPE